MAAAFINPFYSVHVDILWDALLSEFGRLVNYWPQADPQQSAPVMLIWPEGVEDEEITPGRYSHALVQHVSLPVELPALGDAIERDGAIFDIVRVNAFAYYYSGLVLKERG